MDGWITCCHSCLEALNLFRQSAIELFDFKSLFVSIHLHLGCDYYLGIFSLQRFCKRFFLLGILATWSKLTLLFSWLTPVICCTFCNLIDIYFIWCHSVEFSFSG